MNTLTDTHCHLDFEAFDGDRAEVLARAKETGVVRILVPGIDLESSAKAAILADRHSNVYAAVGVHPNSALTWDMDSRDELASLAKQKKVIAIGEIGLDYYRDRSPINVQQSVLLAQLELAASLNLPVVLHNREATDDLLDILTEWRANLVKSGTDLANRPGVLHSYSGDFVQAERAILLSFYIGLTGPVTFKNAPELQELVGRLPLNRLLIETDAPFLTPHPFRGKRNEPAHVHLVAEKIAEIQGITTAEVCQVTTENAGRLFGW